MFSLPVTTYNALTIDVEDWFHVCGLPEDPATIPRENRVRKNVDRILALLREFNVTATFFILGALAEADPELAPMIAAEGHEIASHGYSHRMVPQLSPGEFRDEIRKTGALLELQTGKRPAGFRAPQWSLSRATTPWAFTILREEGYRYDSSCNPLPFVGDAQGPRAPFRIETPAGRLVEVPPMVTSTPFGRLPTGGGWGFRFFPMAMISGTIDRLNRNGISGVLYLHPRDMDDDGPRLHLPPLKSFATYGPRSSAEKRIRVLLERSAFSTLERMVDFWDSAY